MPKLLIFASKFNPADDLLGFLPSWTGELGLYFDRISVVAQDTPIESTPDLSVYSLDKSHRGSRFSRLWLWYSLLIRHRREYDAIFLIMAPAWVIVTWPIAKLLNKKIILWYAVWRGSLKLRLATLFCDAVLTSVPEAFPIAEVSQLRAIGQGIDIHKFIPVAQEPVRSSLLFLGRISPVKHIDVLLDALHQLRSTQGLESDISLTIAGAPANGGDARYEDGLHQQARIQHTEQHVVWQGKVPHNQTPQLYQRHSIFVNLTPAGSFDKTMLEAMACGCIVVASNPSLLKFLTLRQAELCMYTFKDSTDLAQKIQHLLALSPSEVAELRQSMRQIVEKHHSQQQWAQRASEAIIRAAQS